MIVNITLVHKIPCTYNLRHRNVAVRADVPLGNAANTSLDYIFTYTPDADTTNLMQGRQYNSIACRHQQLSDRRCFFKDTISIFHWQ